MGIAEDILAGIAVIQDAFNGAESRPYDEFEFPFSDSIHIALPSPSKAVYRCDVLLVIESRSVNAGKSDLSKIIPREYSGYYYVRGYGGILKHGAIEFKNQLLYSEICRWDNESTVRAYAREFSTIDLDANELIDELSTVLSLLDIRNEPLIADRITINVPVGVSGFVRVRYLYHYPLSLAGADNDIDVPPAPPYPTDYPAPPDSAGIPRLSNQEFCAINYPSEPPSIEQFIADNPGYFGRPYFVLVNTTMGYNLIHRRVLSKSGIFTHVAVSNCAIPGTYYTAETYIPCSHCSNYGVGSINVLFTDGMPAKTTSGHVVVSTCGNVSNIVTSAVLE